MSKTIGKVRAVPISSIFSFKIVERAYENRDRGYLLTASEYWEFFLVLICTKFKGPEDNQFVIFIYIKGKSNYSPSSEEICGA